MATVIKIGKILPYTYENGEVYPAIVVKVNEDSTLNLQVFKDGNSTDYIKDYNLEGGQE